MKKIFLILLLSMGFARNSLADSLPATYWVPVTDGSLLEYATYFLGGDNFNHAISTTTFVFWLPIELTGTQLPFFVIGKAADGTWSGQGIKASCQFNDPYFTCDVRFDSLPIDHSKVETVLKKEFKDPADFKGKLQVASFFEGEPHGTVTVRVPDDQLEQFRDVYEPANPPPAPTWGATF